MTRPTTWGRRLAVLAAGAALSTSAFALAPTGAHAVRLDPGHLVTAPEYCQAVYGDPAPCPPPDRPEPIEDPACLRVDVGPLHCPYLP